MQWFYTHCMQEKTLKVLSIIQWYNYYYSSSSSPPQNICREIDCVVKPGCFIVAYNCKAHLFGLVWICPVSGFFRFTDLLPVVYYLLIETDFFAIKNIYFCKIKNPTIKNPKKLIYVYI